MKMVACPRACSRAPNCDVCHGAGEIDDVYAAALEHFPLDAPFAMSSESVHDLAQIAVDDPTEKMSREELTALRMSSRPPAASLEELGGSWLDDVPEDEPTRPSTPDAKRRSTPFPK